MKDDVWLCQGAYTPGRAPLLGSGSQSDLDPQKEGSLGLAVNHSVSFCMASWSPHSETEAKLTCSIALSIFKDNEVFSDTRAGFQG